VSFVMITDTWLVSLDCLNNNNDEIWNRQCGIRHLRSGTSACHHRAGRSNVKDDMPHSHKSAHEIHTYKPTSW